MIEPFSPEWNLKIKFESLFEDYFEEVRFEPDSITGEYLKVNINGHDTYIDPYEEVINLCEYFEYQITQLEGDTAGCVDVINKVVTIDPEYINDENVLLHELIHMVEAQYKTLPSFYYDIEFIALYNKLSKKIQNLNEIILQHTHILNANDVAESGGSHGILFLLKSIEIDLRKNYELGTICGYNRTEMFDK